MGTPTQAVSVALCTHNGEEYIADQLASILNQSRPPREIVLSDDASTDATLERARAVVSDYLAAHPDFVLDFRVIKNSSALGVTQNFEQAILACSHDLVALCDQDDVWAVDRLSQAMLAFAQRPSLLLIHSDARLVDESGAVLPGSLFEALQIGDHVQQAIHHGLAFELLMRRNFVTGATMVIRRELAEVAAPFPPSWVHDEWLAIIAATVGEVDLIAEPLIDYRQHDSNQIGAKKLSSLGKFRRLLEPGAKRSKRLLDRALALVVRLTEMGDAVAVDRVAAARRKLLHEQERSALKPARISRVAPVIRELRSGRYSEFGRGPSDAVRDLLQPLHPAR